MNQSVNSRLIDPGVVRLLLVKCGVRAELDAVADALATAGSPRFDGNRNVLRQLDVALASLGVAGAQYAVTKCGAMQARHGVALVWYADRCWVLLEVGDGVALLDSGSGEALKVRSAEVEDLAAIWIKPRQLRSDTARASRPAMRLMVEGLTKRSGTIVEIAVATFLTSLLAIGTSLFAQLVYDKVVPSFAYSTLWALSGVVAILVFFDFCLRVIRSYLLDRLSTRLDEEVSTEIFKALADVRLDSRPKAIGALAAQIVGLDAARAFFTSSVLFAIAEIPFAALFIAVIGMLAGPIAYIYVVVAVFAILVGVLAQMNIGRLSKQQLQNTYHRNGLLIEAITGVETIKALGAGWKFTKSWRTLTETISSLSLKSRMTLSVASSTAGALSTLAYVSVIVFGVYQIESGSLTVGGLIAATVLGGRVVGPIANGLNLLTQWHMANQSLRAVDVVLSLPRERRSEVELLSPSNLQASFLLENIRFYFDEAPIPTIEIPSLALSPGDRVLVVGAPGSGKSTLMRVLAGLYQPSAGRVLLGGVDIAMLDPELIRSKVAFLPQEIHLFKGTLRENLCMGGAPDDSTLVKVVGMLGLDAAVAEHPRGLDRPISEGGGGLSVGQKQLCGVARLLLRRPKIWLMDEPSSALDAATEKKMYAAIEAALDPADILVIVTHRSASVPFCERVLVMQQGRVVIDEKRADLNDRMRLQAREASTL